MENLRLASRKSIPRVTKQVCEPDWIRRLAQYKSCTEPGKLGELEKKLGASPTSLAISMQTVKIHHLEIEDFKERAGQMTSRRIVEWVGECN